MTNQRYRGGKPQGPAGPGGSERYLLNDPRYLEGLMFQNQMPNVAKELVHPGKGDPAELLMRVILKDERQLNAAVLYFAKCEEFDLPVEKKVLAWRLAGTASIGGVARRELVMAATGIIAPSLYENVGKKQRDGRGDGRDKKEEER